MMATTATTAGTAIIRPKMTRSFFWGCGGSGSSTGMHSVSHRAGCGFYPGRSSSSTKRLRPATTPATVCGTSNAVMRPMGSPQPPLDW